MYRINKDQNINKVNIRLMGIVFIIISSLFSMVTPYLNKIIIDNIISSDKNLEISEIIIIIAILFVSQLIIFYFGNFMVQKLLLNYKRRLVGGIFKKSLSMSSPDYLEEDSGKVHNLYYGYSNTLASSLINYNILLPGFIFQVVITFAILFYISPKLALISIVASPLYLMFVVWNSKKRSVLNQDCIESNDRFVKTANIFKNHIVDMHMIDNDEFFNRIFNKDLMYDIKTTERYYFWFNFGNRLPIFIQMGVPIFILWLGGRYVNSGVLTLGTLIMFSQYITHLFDPLTSVFHIITEIKSMKPYYDVYESFYYKESNTQNAYKEIFANVDGININDAEIYSAGDKFLYNCNMKMADKGLYIIKGPNGSGKSTILKIIAGIYPKSLVKNGSIMINESFYNDISVLQYPLFFFNGSVLDNIMCGQNNSMIDIFDLSNLKKEIHGDKVNLSSGEQQKLALSRVFTEDRKVIFLDEPFSNLEESASAKLKSYIEEIKNEKLVVVIMHDDSLDNIADQVFTISNEELK